MLDDRRNRARFRAWRRGFREADLILGPFADQHLASMTTLELSQFERLLDQPDHDLQAWIVEAQSAPPAFDNAMLGRLRAFLPFVPGLIAPDA
jgi:antitoxin CptB